MADRFVVQRHRARRLHYDLRLEMGGVLVSWAVPKGPTLDAGVRRAAFHVEDHALDYFDFEGVIPAGQYGGGDVIVWDVGTWEPVKGTVDAGELHFDLAGEKLRGRFVLVRTRRGRSGGEEWLLLHKHDEFAVEGWDPEDHPLSVLSGRTNDEVKAGLVTGAELAGLDRLESVGDWRVFGREVAISGLGKQVEGVGKRELLRYTAQVAPVVLPYLVGRELKLRRAALAVGEPAELVAAVEAGAWEWRVSATTEDPELPTHAVIHLDQGEGVGWAEVLILARLHRTALEHLGVTARPKLTGLGGIEIWVPIAAGPSIRQTGAWVRQLSKVVGAVVPDLDVRVGRASRTVVAPYSPRAGGRVSAPIGWEELDDPGLPADGFDLMTTVGRLESKGDLFRPALRHGQRLPELR